MATLSQGDYIGQVTLNTPYPTAEENWHYEVKTTGGKKLANVNVDDLFRVYPELAPTGYFGHYYDDEDRRKADQEFAKNILLAAEHNAGKKALNSLPKIKKNKEDK